MIAALLSIEPNREERDQHYKRDGRFIGLRKVLLEHSNAETSFFNAEMRLAKLTKALNDDAWQAPLVKRLTENASFYRMSMETLKSTNVDYKITHPHVFYHRGVGGKKSSYSYYEKQYTNLNRNWLYIGSFDKKGFNLNEFGAIQALKNDVKSLQKDLETKHQALVAAELAANEAIKAFR